MMFLPGYLAGMASLLAALVVGNHLARRELEDRDLPTITDYPDGGRLIDYTRLRRPP
jgi:hypothetical protein